jgi:hypothetical protein
MSCPRSSPSRRRRPPPSYCSPRPRPPPNIRLTARSAAAWPAPVVARGSMGFWARVRGDGGGSRRLCFAVGWRNGMASGGRLLRLFIALAVPFPHRVYVCLEGEKMLSFSGCARWPTGGTRGKALFVRAAWGPPSLVPLFLLLHGGRRQSRAWWLWTRTMTRRRRSPLTDRCEIDMVIDAYIGTHNFNHQRREQR